MFARIRRRHSAVAAYLALFLALTGSAFAAAQWTGADIVDHSLTTEDIGLNQVTSADIAPNAVTRGRLAFSSVDSQAIVNNTITGSDIYENSIKSGDVDLLTMTLDDATAIDRSWDKSIQVLCPPNMTAVGGGGHVVGSDGGRPAPSAVLISSSEPSGYGRGWTIKAEKIDFPQQLEFQLKKNSDGYVTGFSHYVMEDKWTYRGDWGISASVKCVGF